MRIVFFGIYDCGLVTLEKLVGQGFRPVGVVTKPNSQSERQPVAEWGQANGFQILRPASLKTPQVAQQIAALAPDLIIVAGYHLMIPKNILDLPSWATINVHGSLLPQYRGPNPHKWAIIRGESTTGVTVHVMTPHFDDGEILAQLPIAIDEHDTAGSLFSKLNLLGADLLMTVLEGIQSRTIKGKPQDESSATYYGYPTERDMNIDWTADAQGVRNLVRGLNPRPGAWTRFHRHKLRVWRVDITEWQSASPPGTIVDPADGQLRVSTGTRDVIIRYMTLEEGEILSCSLGSSVRDLNFAKGERFERPSDDSARSHAGMLYGTSAAG